MSVELWIQGARPKTLPLAVSPVLAASMGMWTTVVHGAWGDTQLARPCPVIGGRPPIDPSGDYGLCLTSPGWYVTVALLCLGVALLLQIAANFANDYADGMRGADESRGGRESATGKPQRLTASGLVPAKRVLAAAGVSAALACVCGLAVTVLTGHWWFIMLGLVCLAAGWYYVGGRRPYGYRGWGEAAVFVFFGLVATCGTSYALSDKVPFLVAWMATAIGFVAVGVLCVNNLRDLDDDDAHGKRTWMVRLGRGRGTVFAAAMPVMAVAMLALSTVSRNPISRVLGGASMPCGITADGRTSCPVVPQTDIALAAGCTVMLAVAVVLCALLCRALLGRRYRAALPMASLLSPVLALGFGLLYLMGA